MAGNEEIGLRALLRPGSRVRIRHALIALAVCLSTLNVARAQGGFPPLDMWTPGVLTDIRDRSTLEISVVPHVGYFDVFYTSNPAADWFDSTPPYAERRNGRIRIHAFLASPLVGGPYPALVIGHGHGGSADRDLALFIASLGYVALAIDGPEAGQSTGGPRDENQAWISVDAGPRHGYLYHYAYAGMRALTLLEELASRPGNPYRIDAARLGVLGASMGGILTTHVNGIDSRVRAAIIIASAGNWHPTLRYPNSWLYHGIYAGTRDVPYNGNDPQNSIEDIDTDPTAIRFVNYFDPIRYAPRQHAPVLTVIGTHDQYFPLPSANLMHLAITSAAAQPNFEKRLWLLPNAPHGLDTAAGLLSLVVGIREWLDYSFGRRDRPLATPTVAKTGLRFEISLDETPERLSGVAVTLYAGTRVDSTVTPIRDFEDYAARREGDRFVVEIPSGELTASGDPITSENVLYYATAVDAKGLPVSSLVYKGRRPDAPPGDTREGIPMDLSTGFVPAIEPFPGSTVVAPVPPPPAYAATSVAGSRPLPDDASFQGVALTNATDSPMALRLEARDRLGRVAASEGLVNPAFVTVSPRAQRVFLIEQWMGPGARRLDGSLRVLWSDARAASLAFRGNIAPADLEGIGPLETAASPLWVPLAPEQAPTSPRSIRVTAPAGGGDVDFTVTFRNRVGDILEVRPGRVPAGGAQEIVPSAGTGQAERASAEIRAASALAARLEVRSAGDSWSIEARPVPAAARYVQPHVEWNGLFRTRLLLLNAAAGTVRATLRLRTPAGIEQAPAREVSVPGGSVVSETVESLFGIAPAAGRGAGWLEIETQGGPLAITALAVDDATGAGAASAVGLGGGGLWSLPFFVESPGWFTGLAMANPGTGPVTVRITAYDEAGSVLARETVVLGPRESRTALVFQWLAELAAGRSGHLEFSVSAPLALLSYFGTDDGASLAAIPFTLLP